ncbi:MAG: TlpA family protein disulfide reductase [Candidatus Rokubacteria bacterium]|nr:TlpA family protein disulfide reductase [Candidatus Rokubacteria bacterium]
MWQALYEELKALGFVVITVALDRGPEDARPWIEAARPTHPSLIDVGHAVADLYNMVNVPTVVWIDERGRIVRPNDVAFGTDTFRHITGIEAARHLGALRAWARGQAPVMAAREVRALQRVPSQADQQARAEFGLGRWLAERGRGEAAERHFVRAGELAPHDFTIRRGTMPIRGIDPMGPAFRAMLEEWVGAGKSYYRPLPD